MPRHTTRALVNPNPAPKPNLNRDAKVLSTLETDIHSLVARSESSKNNLVQLAVVKASLTCMPARTSSEIDDLTKIGVKLTETLTDTLDNTEDIGDRLTVLEHAWGIQDPLNKPGLGLSKGQARRFERELEAWQGRWRFNPSSNPNPVWRSLGGRSRHGAQTRNHKM